MTFRHQPFDVSRSHLPHVIVLLRRSGLEFGLRWEHGFQEREDTANKEGRAQHNQNDNCGWRDGEAHVISLLERHGWRHLVERVRTGNCK